MTRPPTPARQSWLIVHRDPHTGQWTGPRTVSPEVAERYGTEQARRGVRTLAVDLDGLEQQLAGEQ